MSISMRYEHVHKCMKLIVYGIVAQQRDNEHYSLFDIIISIQYGHRPIYANMVVVVI